MTPPCFGEREISPPFFFSFPCEAPSAFQLVIALVRLDGLASDMNIFFTVLVLPKSFYKTHLSRGLRLNS